MMLREPSSPVSPTSMKAPFSPMASPAASPRGMRVMQMCCVARHAERADAAYALYRGAPYVHTQEYAQYPFDPPLSDDGERGALELAQEIKLCAQKRETTIDVVICSPYLRCAQTAAVICRELGPSTILMFDQSCGEIFGEAIFGPTEPEVVHRDFASVVEDCKARGVIRIAPMCVGTRPCWGETLPDGRQRFNEAFLAYVHRGTEKTRNFLVVTHADCVAAAATLLPGARDISKVHPGAVLMAQRYRPIGPGDGWSMMSSETSVDKRTEKIVWKSLSRSQGWTVDSSNIDFCTTARSKESVMKRMVASFRKFTARSKLGEDRVKYLLKAFSGDRRRGTSSVGSPPASPSNSSHGTHDGTDPALWIFACEEGDSLAKMPSIRSAWVKAPPRGRRALSPGSKSPRSPTPPRPGSNKLSIPVSVFKPRGNSSSEEEQKPPKTLRALIMKSNTNAGSSSTNLPVVGSSEEQNESEMSSSSPSLSRKDTPTTPTSAPKPKAYLQLPSAGMRRGGIKDMSSSPLWRRRQNQAGGSPATMSLAEVMKSSSSFSPEVGDQPLSLTEVMSARRESKSLPILEHMSPREVPPLKTPVRFGKGDRPWKLPLPPQEPQSMDLPNCLPDEPADSLPKLNSFALVRPKSRQ